MKWPLTWDSLSGQGLSSSRAEARSTLLVVTHRVFSYGTLRLPHVQQALYGRAVPTTPDTLPAYRIDWLTITDAQVIATSGVDRHPILREGGPGEVVRGAYLELTDDELAATDAYEVGDYARMPVTLGSGTAAWVYLAAEPSSA